MIWSVLFGISACLAFVPVRVAAADPSVTPLKMDDVVAVEDSYMRGVVDHVVSSEETPDPTGMTHMSELSMMLAIRMVSGEENGKLVFVPYHTNIAPGSAWQHPSAGDGVIVVKTSGPDGAVYYVREQNRLGGLLTLVVAFILITLFCGGKRGGMAFLGLIMTLVVIGGFIVPAIAHGYNPTLVSLIGTVAISVISLLIAHGRSKRIYIALLSTLITVCISFGLAALAIHMAQLFGTGSEESMYLQTAPFGPIDLRGLLLGGMIIGLLGILDDSTTAQAAAVDEIYSANPTYGWRELYRRGMSVGREHITALVNTLALAYTGASLPLLLLFVAYPQPWWVTLNSEPVAEEIVRTLVGSVGLLLAVPLTTLIAAWYFAYYRPRHSLSV